MITPVRIRSVTIGVNPESQPFETLEARLNTFRSCAANAFDSLGMEIQTWRLVLPAAEPTPDFSRFTMGNRIAAIERIASQAGIRWLCQPFRCISGWSKAELTATSLELIRRHPNLFVHFLVGEKGHIYWEMLESVSKIILSVSRLSANGFDNFRVGAGCHIRPNTPFFPFSYHVGKDGFSLAVEIIGLLKSIARKFPAVSVTELREIWVQALVEACRDIGKIAAAIEQESGWEFKGMDISLAPYPGSDKSVANLIENIGPRHTGQSGTVAITAILTDILKTALDRSGVRLAGFNGVMYSVMEDEGLAAANNARHLTLEKLMNFSTVCGCGIDMVPLAGGVFPEEIANILLDTATLALRLNKPLGVRVLPIPMKVSNELTDFNHDFLVNTRIFSAGGDCLQRPLSGDPNLGYLTRANCSRGQSSERKGVMGEGASKGNLPLPSE